MTQLNNIARSNHQSTLELKELSKREYFAGLALQGLLTQPLPNSSETSLSSETIAFPSPSGTISYTFSTPTQIAAYAVSLADAMIAELDKTETSPTPVQADLG